MSAARISSRCEVASATPNPPPFSSGFGTGHDGMFWVTWPKYLLLVLHVVGRIFLLDIVVFRSLDSAIFMLFFFLLLHPHRRHLRSSFNSYLYIAHIWNQLPTVTKSSSTLAQFRARLDNVNFTGCRCMNCV